MKNKFSITILSLFAFTQVNAQVEQFPNGDFEDWAVAAPIAPFELPNYWFGEPNTLEFPYFWYTETAHSGDYALKMRGGITWFNGEPTIDFPMMILMEAPGNFHQTVDLMSEDLNNVYPGFGTTFSSRPDSIVGWCKYYHPNALPNQEFMILAALTKWNSTTQSPEKIGEVKLYHPPTADVYTRFSAPITYFSSDVPDTLRSSIGAIQLRYLTEHPPTWLDPVAIQSVVELDLILDDVEFVYNSQASVNSLAKAEDFIIFPNPATHSFSLKSESIFEGKIEVTDLNGEIVVSEECGDSFTKTISTSNIANGIYFVNIYSENSIIKTEKLVIQH